MIDSEQVLRKLGVEGNGNVVNWKVVTDITTL